MKKILMSVMALGLMTSSVYGVCSAKACEGKVESIFMTANGNLEVIIEGDMTQLNCGATTLSLKNSDAGKDAMYSLILTAQTTGKNVLLRVEEGSEDCRVKYVKSL